MVTGYTHEVRFKQTFIGGNLDGLTVEGSTKFCSIKYAQEWVNRALGNPECYRPCGGGSPYRITEPYIFVIE